ncbi:MAG: deoxyribonuclease IV [Thermoplasmatota archaeon]
MAILGAHVSIAGGISRSVARAKDIGCETFQIFTKNQRQWNAPPLDENDVSEFRKLLSGSGMGPVIAHDSYLINLGAPNDEVFGRSVEAFSDELERCSKLGIGYLVTHPGSHVGSGEDTGISRIAEGLDMAWSRFERDSSAEWSPMVLLETTAGQGTNIGHTFEQLAMIMERTGIEEHIGICFDTCHAYASGYDITTMESYRETMSSLERTIGMDRLKAVHINDSKKGLGSRVDRHSNIGEGMIGLEGFRHLLNDIRMKDVPMILETPGGDEAYMRNLELLRSLLR